MGKRPTSQKDEECPECGNKVVWDSIQRESICNYCGLVIEEDKVDDGPGWRAFDHKQRMTKPRAETGIKPTIIDVYGRDALGRKISSSTRIEMLRLNRWQVRSAFHSARDRNFALAEPELDRLCDLLHLPKKVRELAWRIYQQCFEKNLVRGRSIDGIMASAVRVACRRLNVPRSLKEISKASKVKKSDVNRNERLIIRKLELKQPVHDPAIFIEPFGDKLKLSQKAKHKAFQIIKKAKEEGLTAGRNPEGLAAAALYIACILTGEKRRQQDISKVSGVTEVTIRSRYKDLKEKLKIDLDNTKFEIPDNSDAIPVQSLELPLKAQEVTT